MPNSSRTKQIEILMVEDSIEDATLARVALQSSKVKSNICLVQDGVDAMAYLRREPPFDTAARPDTILLDINMPRKNGLETLAEIRADPNLTNIPIVMLTTSSSDNDIAASYDLHVNCYIVKPVAFEEFMELVKTIESFWFKVIKLPPRNSKKSNKVA